MNIGDFIEAHVDRIVEEWVQFAGGGLPAAHTFTHEQLADHARVLLLALAADIKKAQGAQAKHEKSQGDRPENSPDITRIAREHAVQRFDQGFSFDHLVSEFRALRASVIRRWTKQLDQPRHEDLDQLTRFGESMDQALSESTSLYTRRHEDSRNLLLGILGHDLRTPLGVVDMSAQYLLRTDTLTAPQTKAVVRIRRAAERMNGMVKDILDFTQTAFGVALPITPVAADFGAIAANIVGEVAALHPDSEITLTSTGDLRGRWDAGRMGQLMSNLIANAVQHGAPGETVKVVLDGDADSVSIEISNAGTPIPADTRKNLFSPMRQRPSTQGEKRSGSSGLGLGLYITKEIATAHGGSIVVSSSSEQTSFAVRIPRVPPHNAERRRASDAQATSA
jgi:signal transduction histidine kinase